VTDHFPKGSVVRRVNEEPAIGFGAGRALLLQLAHPSVAQGVEDHSEFKRNPFKRLQGTLEATYGVAFGSEELAAGIGRRLHWIHTFIVGPTYQANTPALLFWVHATLADTALRCNEEYLGPLSPADAATYYEEMQRVAEVFGIDRADQPATLEEFRAYVDEQVASLEVTDVAKDLIGFILDPVLPFGAHLPFVPLLRLQKLVTLGSLPEPIRAQLDVRWGPAEQARYDRFQRTMQRVFRATPRPLRVAPTRAYGRVLLALAERQVNRFDTRQPGRANEQEAIAS
jgi:uncharacterized protein (DUF2236 family)